MALGQCGGCPPGESSSSCYFPRNTYRLRVPDGVGHFFFVLVLISVKTGLSLWPWANVVVALRVEVALHDILLVVPIVCACPAAWGVGNLHQTAAVEEEPCPSAVGSMSPGAVELVEEEAFDRFRHFEFNSFGTEASIKGRT